MDQKTFVSELAKLRPSSTFLSLLGYRNEASEIADYNIVFHMSYENALKKSISILEDIDPTDSLQATAKQELIDGYNTSLKKMQVSSIEEIDDAYSRFYDEDNIPIKGIKLHDKTNTLHLYGLVNFKRVLMPGSYPNRNRKELTIAKDNLRKIVPVGKFRQFKITPDHVNHISVENLSLLPPQ